MLARTTERLFSLFATFAAVNNVPLDETTEPLLLVTCALLSKLDPLRFAFLYLIAQTYLVYRRGKSMEVLESVVQGVEDILP